MSLDWFSFKKLDGDPRKNFENLCRGIVRSHWGSYGLFKSLRNQPGVEFHLKLTQDCEELGKPPRWYGWQCKYYDSPPEQTLNEARRKGVIRSLDATIKKLPELTDWVLWTPFTLRKPDQDWFYNLASRYSFNLHLCTSEDIENLLVGPSVLLREAYFGELVLTPKDLKKKHDESIEIIKDRWISDIHQMTYVERKIRRMLGDISYWEEIDEIGKNLYKAMKEIEAQSAQYPDIQDVKNKFLDACRTLSEMLVNFRVVLSEGDIDTIRQWLSDRKSIIDLRVKSFPRLLRKKNSPVSLIATNTLDDMRIAQKSFSEVEKYLDVGIVAVLADAGGGKTHMAAEISSKQENRPAGILLHGRNLKGRDNHDDLASQVVVNGTRLDSMEKLLACLDSAAKRAGCILPLVIDGLNEAENPKNWKDILSHIQLAVKEFPNVLVICTLRTGEHKRHHRFRYGEEIRESFAVQALPENIWREECEGFGEDLMEAIDKYFKFFKIECEERTEIPEDFLDHPLNLRIFCEVTNPKRESPVEIGLLPTSLSPLFNKYIESACNRISSMRSLPHNLEQLKTAVYKLGINLWEANDREVCEQVFRDAIGDSNREWDVSVVNLFAQEGLIFRNPGTEPGKYMLAPIYDALGGHIIASSLLQKNSQDRTFKWFNKPSTISVFSGEQSHPLSHDIFKSLVSLVPNYMYGHQLWKNVSKEFEYAALLYAIDLPPEKIDTETVTALAELVAPRKNPSSGTCPSCKSVIFDKIIFRLRAFLEFLRVPLVKKSKEEHKIFSRLWRTKSALNHPLNADFLDSVLLNMPIAERDLGWTEWVRKMNDRGGLRGEERITLELDYFEKKWKADLIKKRTEVDRLRAKTTKWLLTSTDYQIRNTATRALYWFGRGDPEYLFDETIKSFEINDPYVPERMLAASYGIAMSLSVKPSGSSEFTKTVLRRFASSIFEKIFNEGAVYYTTHQFFRDYASKIIELTRYHNPTFLTDENFKKTQAPYATEECGKWGESYIGENAQKRQQSPFFVDFENYTIGRLVPSRSIYEYEHDEYKKVRAQLQWRVEELGWTHDRFANIDKEIEEQNYRGQFSRFSRKKYKIDRYGKKYSWIAYYEMFGLLKDKGVLEDEDFSRTVNQNIDCSFSSSIESQTERFINENFLGEPDVDLFEWIRKGEPPNVEPFLILDGVNEQKVSWIILDGHVNQESKDLKRATFFFIRSFLVPRKDKDEILNYLRKQNLEDRWLPEKHNFYQTFIAEVPWSSSFPNENSCNLSFAIRNDKVSQKTNAKYSEKQEKFKTFEVIMPVCDMNLNVIENESTSAPILTKKIVTEMELIVQPQSIDLYTKNDEKVTNFIHCKGDGFRDGHSVYYIRKDILSNFMEKNDLCLIWVVWGERECSFNWSVMHNDNLPGPRYAVFSIVEEYKENKID